MDETVEDLVQDTFLSVVKGADSFRADRGTLSSWIFSIAGNVYRQKTRNRRAAKREAQEISLETLPGLEVTVADRAASDPLRAMLAEEQHDLLRNALESLPPQMKLAVTLRLDRDLRYHEIADVMKVSIETVKAHLYQARQALRDIMAEYFTDLDL